MPNMNTYNASEQRFTRQTKIRAESSAGKTYAVGYAATFNTLSHDLGGFKERISRGAFSNAIRARQDTKFCLNHSPNQLLARVKNGTLELSEDNIGLFFRAQLPDTTLGRDFKQQLAEGLIDECSFAFRVSTGQSWTREKDPATGEIIDVRSILQVDELADCSAVVYPAYPGTDVAVGRSLWPNGMIPVEIRSRVPNIGLVDQDRQRRERLDAAIASLPIDFEELREREAAQKQLRRIENLKL